MKQQSLSCQCNIIPDRHVLPDSGWCWLIVAGNLLLSVLTLGYFRCLSLFFKPLMLEFNVNYASVSLITGLYCIGLAIGSFCLPYLSGKHGYKVTGMVTGFVLGVSNIISTLSKHFIVIQFFSGFLTGCCGGILFFTSVVTSSEYFAKHRSLATGITVFGVTGGCLVLAPILSIAIETYGWRGALLLSSGLMFNTCVSSALYRPIYHGGNAIKKTLNDNCEERTKQSDSSSGDGTSVTHSEQECKLIERSLNDPRENDCSNRSVFEISEDSEQKADPLPKKKNVFRSIKEKITGIIDFSLFRSLSYDVAVLSSVFFYCGYVCINVFIYQLGVEAIGLAGLRASSILTLQNGAESFGNLFFGCIADLKCTNRVLLLVVTVTLSAACSSVLTLCSDYISLLIMAMVYGLFAVAYFGVSSVVFCDIVGVEKISKAIGYHGFIYNILLGPWLCAMGWAIDASGNIFLPFYISSVLFALSTVCLLLVWRLQKLKEKNKLEEEEEAISIGPSQDL